MPLTIVELNDLAMLHNGAAQVAEGLPLEITTDLTGALTLNPKTKIIKIVGYGSITWSNGKVEPFQGLEYRGVGTLLSRDITVA